MPKSRPRPLTSFPLGFSYITHATAGVPEAHTHTLRDFNSLKAVERWRRDWAAYRCSQRAAGLSAGSRRCKTTADFTDRGWEVTLHWGPQAVASDPRPAVLAALGAHSD